jgi:hypothetical protein
MATHGDDRVSDASSVTTPAMTGLVMGEKDFGDICTRGSKQETCLSSQPAVASPQ